MGASPTVLVTGAMGFLGRCTVRALLNLGNFSLACIVRPLRPTSRQSGHISVAAWGVQSDLAELDQACVYAGDISCPNLGLLRDVYDDLARRVRVVIHMAARTSLHGRSQDIYDQNVRATQEVVNFCAASGAYLLHVSSTSVLEPLDNTVGTTPEHIEAKAVDTMPLYTRSKARSEELVRQYLRTNGQGKIVRLCRLFPGASGLPVNESDFAVVLLRACMRLGAYPDSGPCFDFIPVDFVAGYLARLAISEGNGAVVVNATLNTTTNLSSLMELPVPSLRHLTKLPYDLWYERVCETVDRNPMDVPNEILAARTLALRERMLSRILAPLVNTAFLADMNYVQIGRPNVDAGYLCRFMEALAANEGVAQFALEQI